ncbi:uncharacterized protein A1O9_00239 [Exophiala aquamarina CBS 119918]|uniref:Uncharacterized protein n=1 Tax=Exophiala aquamarina CBS 119918 TaxID=1182545 RepID=A0A072PRC8_9EURO|nr:uncharacterized protein A1O9_00239 [Exophiala aquamarina CBS 119918]KEF62267.1 hypothetical protein A1O9_00239 [Exophiala aquamarina CBS 119918]
MTSDLTGSSPTSTILNEIANFAASRKRSSQSRAPIPVFKDSSDLKNTSLANRNAVSEAPAFSTDSIESSSTDMGLREVSVNLQRTSPNSAGSPYYASLRTSARRRSSQAEHRFNSEDYIQHIENELQMVKDAMYSPNTHLPWKEKLKKARQENDQLKKEVETLKSSFELEIRNTVERLTENELRLKRKVRDLEEDVERKDAIIQELEYNREELRLDQGSFEALRARIDRLEDERSSLELTNRGMTKRNEVLTQLLALSPTKSHHGVELPTPRRRNARPMSLIIPRVPSSPLESAPLSRPQSVLISPRSTANYFARYNLSSPVVSSPCGGRTADTEANDDIHSVDSGLGESCTHSINQATSRRSTLASHVSSSPELPPTSYIHNGERPSLHVRQPSKRRPRKFIPGSTQLKPLLLPTYTAEHGNLPSPPPLTSPQRSAQASVDSESRLIHRGERSSQPGDVDQDIATSVSYPDCAISAAGPSFQSLDEVFAKLGETVERDSAIEPRQSDDPGLSQGTHPTTNSKANHARADISLQSPRPRITSWVLKTTPTPSAGADLIYDHGHPAAEQREFCRSDRASEMYTSDRPNQESDLDISPVEIPRPLFSRAVSRSIDEVYLEGRSHLEESPLHPRKRRKADSRTDVKLPLAGDHLRNNLNPGTYAANPRPVLSPKSINDRTPPGDKIQRRSSYMVKAGSNTIRGPLELLQHKSIASKPLAAITIQTVYATLSRYTTYIQTLKQDPLALARRVIANAWRSNWAVFGKMSWWVLGLFISRRTSISNYHEWDWDAYDGESIAQKYCSNLDSMEDSDDRVNYERSRTAHILNGGSDEPANASQGRNKQKTSPENTKASWGKSLFLWGKFSVAIMLAVGGAIIRGPGEMLRETDDKRRSRSNSIEHVSRRASIRPSDVMQGSNTLLASFKAARLSPSDGSQGAGTIRKLRSFSSPIPSSGYHRPGLSVASSSTTDRFLADVTNTQLAHDFIQGCEGLNLSSFLNDDTLKPRRTERKGIESIFPSSPDEVTPNATHMTAAMVRRGHKRPQAIDNASCFSDYG